MTKALLSAILVLVVALFVPNLRIASDPFVYEAYTPSPVIHFGEFTLCQNLLMFAESMASLVGCFTDDSIVAVPLRLSASLGKGKVLGLESVAFDKDGYLFGGSADGLIVKLNPKTDEVVNTLNVSLTYYRTNHHIKCH